jgi:hypothetical protein
MIERRLREASAGWFPATPSVAGEVRERLPVAPDRARRRLPRRTLAVAVAALALAGTALAASELGLVPGVRIDRVERLPEVGYAMPLFGQETSLDELPFDARLPEGAGTPDTLLLDHDRDGAPVVTAIYGDAASARLVLTQWRADTILFHKLLDHYARSEPVEVEGEPGVWIEGGDHAVFYLGRSVAEQRVGGYLTGNVLVWRRGPMSYRLELGGTRAEALELARSLRPPR